VPAVKNYFEESHPTTGNSGLETLVDSDGDLEPLELDDQLAVGSSPRDFLTAINRGGLSRPTVYCYTTTFQCWRIYEEIKETATLKEKLLAACNQRALFNKVVERAIEVDNGLVMVDANYCTKGHDIREHIWRRFFNCVAKNLVKELTSAANPTNEKSAKKRKIAKLTSKQSTT
jgi:hypothetical protein